MNRRRHLELEERRQIMLRWTPAAEALLEAGMDPDEAMRLAGPDPWEWILSRNDPKGKSGGPVP